MTHVGANIFIYVIFGGSDWLPHLTNFDDLFDFFYCVYGGILQGQPQ